MKRYHFEIESPLGTLSFWVTADSRVEAIDDLEEGTDATSIYLGLSTPGGRFRVAENFRVNDSHIIGESPLAFIPEKALLILAERNYDNGEPGLDLENWRQLLRENEEEGWMKSFLVGEGPSAGIYGFMKVRAHLNADQTEWLFSIRAYLYPVRGARNFISEGAPPVYKVDFRSAQIVIKEEDLAQALDMYEKKFSELIYVLRQADPGEGLPLTEEEEATGRIQGFMTWADFPPLH